MLILSSSRRFSLNGIRPGDRARAARRRLRGERRFQVGGTVWYVATHDGSRTLVKTRAGKVLALGLADPLLTEQWLRRRRVSYAAGGAEGEWAPVPRSSG